MVSAIWVDQMVGPEKKMILINIQRRPRCRFLFKPKNLDPKNSWGVKDARFEHRSDTSFRNDTSFHQNDASLRNETAAALGTVMKGLDPTSLDYWRL
jgi:hypothetical protein